MGVRISGMRGVLVPEDCGVESIGKCIAKYLGKVSVMQGRVEVFDKGLDCWRGKFSTGRVWPLEREGKGTFAERFVMVLRVDGVVGTWD